MSLHFILLFLLLLRTLNNHKIKPPKQRGTHEVKMAVKSENRKTMKNERPTNLYASEVHKYCKMIIMWYHCFNFT